MCEKNVEEEIYDAFGDGIAQGMATTHFDL